MDRIHLILAALSAAANEPEDASNAVEGVLGELKGLVKPHLGGDADAEMVLERYEDMPDDGPDRLKEALESTGSVDKDFAIVSAAQELLKLVDPEGSAGGKYAVQAKPLRGLKMGH